MLQPHSHCQPHISVSDLCISCGRWAQSLWFFTCNRLGLETHPRGSMWPQGGRSTALDGKLLLTPGPFPVNLCEVLYIVHSEEFINKCFLSLFRNASPFINPPSTFLSRPHSFQCKEQDRARQEQGSCASSCCRCFGRRQDVAGIGLHWDYRSSRQLWSQLWRL